MTFLSVHAITIGDKNTYEDWKLIPTSRPLFAAPTPKTSYVDIPGADGALDYTEVLSGVKYNNRQGSWEFKVLNGYAEWYNRYSEIMNYLQGKKFRVILDDEPDYFYNARLSVNSWSSDKDWSTIVIDYIAEPYKYPINSTASYDWLWNELFDNTIYYGIFDVVGSKWRNFINDSVEDIEVSVTTTSPMTVFIDRPGEEDDDVVFLEEGTTSAALTLSPGDNIFTFYGTGRVTVDYSKGRSL